MTGGNGFLRQWRPAWVAATACALLGCMGGTGTDTENGVYVSAQVVDSSGDPVGNVEISVLDLSARVDSTLTNPLYDQNVVLVTNDSGKVNFFLKKNGTYMAAGKRGDTVLFIDTLRTRAPTGNPGSPGGLGNPSFLVETPVRASGKVRLNSGLTIDTGRVLLRGTTIMAALTDSGAYDLDWLPSAAQKAAVTIVYEGRARPIRYVKVSAQGTQLTVHASNVAGRCLSDSTASVSAALTTTGSLSSKADLARIAGKACAFRVGALVRVLEVGATGAVTRTLGDYVIPSPDAPKIWEVADADSSAVPAACIEPEHNLAGLTGRATIRLANKDIVVNDFKSGKGCLQ
jgi:hypothetical protein